MKYKFSQQQIIGINYYYAKIVDDTFDEDDVRLLLIHLREFLLNNDNVNARGRHNASLLMELGNSVAHTIRDQGEIYGGIRKLVRQFASANQGGNWVGIPFTLFDIQELIETFKTVLIDTGVLYRPGDVEKAFRCHSVNLKLCLLCMLDGMLLKICYPESTKDFFVTEMEGKHYVHIRTELALSHVTSLREIALDALIPRYGGGTFAQRILCCELSDLRRVDRAALKRTASSEGYCESVKALRCDGELVITKITPNVDPIEVYKILKASSYDTHPISQGVTLTILG